MSVFLRPGKATDATTLGEICYSAFKAIAEAHNFPPDFPSPDMAAALLAGYLSHDGFFSVRIVQTMTLMTIGFYNEPNGSWLPSVTF